MQREYKQLKMGSRAVGDLLPFISFPEDFYRLCFQHSSILSWYSYTLSVLWGHTTDLCRTGELVLGAWGDGIGPANMRTEFGSPVLRLGTVECACNPSHNAAKTGGSPELLASQSSQTTEHQVQGKAAKNYGEWLERWVSC